MNRRDMLKMSVGASVLASMVPLEGCSFGQGVDEFINILNLMNPAVEGILGVVELVDPPVGAVVQAGVTIFEQEVPIVTKIYNDFKNATAASQPGVLATLQTVIGVLKQDAVSILNAAHVNDPLHQNAIDNLINSVLNEISEISTLITVARSNGGTTSAALKATGTKKTLGKPVTTSKAFKSSLLKHLDRKTGDAKLDAVNTATATKLRAAA